MPFGFCVFSFSITAIATNFFLQMNCYDTIHGLANISKHPFTQLKEAVIASAGESSPSFPYLTHRF